MEAADGSFDSNFEDVFGYTKPFNPIDHLGIRELCMWAVDLYGYESARTCYMLPVCDPHKTCIAGSGELLIERGDFVAHRKFLYHWGYVAFVINSNAKEPEFVFKVTNAHTRSEFLFRGMKIRNIQIKKGTDVSFEGTGTVNGDPSPSGKDYRFKVWAKDSGDSEESYNDKFHLQIYWRQPKTGIWFYEFDNEISHQTRPFRGDILIDL